MRLAILLILLCAAFLGGYYVARLPGSPDIFGKAQQAYNSASDAGRQLDDLFQQAQKSLGASGDPSGPQAASLSGDRSAKGAKKGKTVISADGTSYYVSPDGKSN
jgi:hypothetical protein